VREKRFPSFSKATDVEAEQKKVSRRNARLLGSLENQKMRRARKKD